MILVHSLEVVKNLKLLRIKYFIEIMNTNNQITRRYYQIFISHAHDDDSNPANPLFRNLKSLEKNLMKSKVQV